MQSSMCLGLFKYFFCNLKIILYSSNKKNNYFIFNSIQKALMQIWPGGNLSPLSKRELIYTGSFGLSIWYCGITFIDRFNSKNSLKTMDSLAKKIKDEKVIMRLRYSSRNFKKNKYIYLKKKKKDERLDISRRYAQHKN